MRTPGTLRLPFFATLCSAILLAPTLAVPQEQTKQGEHVIQARQGFMRVVVLEAGPLFGMAKGDIAYDAAAAQTHAEQLNAILDYDVGRLFIPDTSKSVYTGKTRALAAIWKDMDDFASKYQALRDEVAVVVEEAGKGKDALTAAVSEMGKACGNCHDDYRAEEF